MPVYAHQYINGTISDATTVFNYNETGGTVVNDTASRINGTLNNADGNEWVTGLWGNMIYLEGLNDYVSVANTRAQPKTVVTFFNSTTPKDQSIFGHGSDAYFYCTLQSTGNVSCYAAAGAAITFTSKHNFYNNGSMFFVSFSESGTNTTLSLWNDGNLMEFLSVTHANGGLGPTSHYFGYRNGGTYFNGSLEDSIIFNKVLNYNEIKSIANQTIDLPLVVIITNITDVWLTSPDPDQKLYPPFAYGNTSDDTPTFNLTTNSTAECFLGIDNSTWVSCTTTNATGHICTQSSSVSPTGTKSEYFRCNTSTNNLTYLNVSYNYIEPLILLINPENNSLSVNKYATFAYNISATNNSSVSLWINGVLNETKSNIQPIIVNYFYKKFANEGYYNWTLNATNAEMNINATGYFTVDEVPWEVNGTILIKNGALIVRH